MGSPTLEAIEKQIAGLSASEQLWLIERLAHRLRGGTSVQEASLEKQLALMAADPDIQRELRQINEEFKETEGDGLEQFP